VQSLWNRIAATPDQVPVPDWHREVLDERLKDYEADPDAGESWDVVRDRLRDKPRPR
jgi:putative addiction module component (TIGR02574 family)